MLPPRSHPQSPQTHRHGPDSTGPDRTGHTTADTPHRPDQTGHTERVDQTDHTHRKCVSDTPIHKSVIGHVSRKSPLAIGMHAHPGHVSRKPPLAIGTRAHPGHVSRKPPLAIGTRAHPDHPTRTAAGRLAAGCHGVRIGIVVGGAHPRRRVADGAPRST